MAVDSQSIAMTLMLISLIASIIGAFLAIGLYVATSWFAMQLFRQRGVEPWAAWIPYFREWRLFELTGINPIMILAVLIPGLGSIFITVLIVIAYYRLATAHGANGVAAAILGVLFMFPPYLMTAKRPFDPNVHWSQGWKGPFVGPVQQPKPLDFFVM